MPAAGALATQRARAAGRRVDNRCTPSRVGTSQCVAGMDRLSTAGISDAAARVVLMRASPSPRRSGRPMPAYPVDDTQLGAFEPPTPCLAQPMLVVTVSRRSGWIHHEASRAAHAPTTVRVGGGRVMKKLRDIMRSGFLFTVQKDATVSEAVRLMVDHNVGIVIVIDRDRLVGVFSERDVVRRVLHQGLDPATLPVSEVMTPNVVTADAEMDYESAMSAMDEAGIRHLLVTSGSKMLSMISIRDLTRAVLHDREEEVQHLREYLYQVPAQSPGPYASA